MLEIETFLESMVRRLPDGTSIDGSLVAWILALFLLALVQLAWTAFFSIDGHSRRREQEDRGAFFEVGSGSAEEIAPTAHSWSLSSGCGADAALTVVGTRKYRLAAKLAEGDLCDVHYAVRDDQPYVLKTSRFADCNQLLWKERQVLRRLLDEYVDCACEAPFPWPVETFRLDGCWGNAFRWRDGFLTAEQVLQRHPGGLSGRQIAWIFKRTLDALGHAHQRGWVHGAVFPPHLLIHTTRPGLLLVDWIHAERRGRPLRIAARRFRHWYPPECHDRRPAEASTDVYMAARSMVFLAGGDPLGNTMPPQVPAKVSRFFRACLLDSPNMRPPDAWQLQDEFCELCETVYGLDTITT